MANIREIISLLSEGEGAIIKAIKLQKEEIIDPDISLVTLNERKKFWEVFFAQLRAALFDMRDAINDEIQANQQDEILNMTDSAVSSQVNDKCNIHDENKSYNRSILLLRRSEIIASIKHLRVDSPALETELKEIENDLVNSRPISENEAKRIRLLLFNLKMKTKKLNSKKSQHPASMKTPETDSIWIKREFRTLGKPKNGLAILSNRKRRNRGLH